MEVKETTTKEWEMKDFNRVLRNRLNRHVEKFGNISIEDATGIAYSVMRDTEQTNLIIAFGIERKLDGSTRSRFKRVVIDKKVYLVPSKRAR